MSNSIGDMVYDPDAFHRVHEELKNEQEAFWNSLSKEDQLKAFCAVVRRINDGESEGHSYRGMLYGVFGFGPEAYAQAQLAGFLELHNNIVDSDYDGRLLRAFCKKNGLDEKLVEDWLL